MTLEERLTAAGVKTLEELEAKINRDDWNTMRVIARGYQFTHLINGHVMTVSYDEDTVNRKASGILAFQLHSGPPMKIRIKDISIRAYDTQP